jgi:stage V sporulation protein B
MAVVIAIVYQGLGLFIASNTIKTLFSVCCAVVVYFALFLLLKGLNKEELFDFPMGRRLYLLACKMHVMK